MQREGNGMYQRNYEIYLSSLQGVDFQAVSGMLGARLEGEYLLIPFFSEEFRVGKSGIISPAGKRPPYPLCVILLKYVLLCPQESPREREWVTYRDFRNSAPLVDYFHREVEGRLSTAFSGKGDVLHLAGVELKGYQPDVGVNTDVSIRFDALPRVPLVLLFNDRDEEFPADCTVLFEKRAEEFLDCECLAMLGSDLVRRLLGEFLPQ